MLYFHVPLIVLGIVIAAVTRGIGFIWLALLVVLAELLIVLTRFVFSYEQAFMADLVRFWYGALFLFASAYTLLEEGHVRVDLLYASMRRETKGRVNAWGAVLLGMILLDDPDHRLRLCLEHHRRADPRLRGDAIGFRDVRQILHGRFPRPFSR